MICQTGMKVYGEGEWQVNTHGTTRRRVWRKIHLGIDEATGDVVACEVTESGTHEEEELPGLLSGEPPPVNRLIHREYLAYSRSSSGQTLNDSLSSYPLIACDSHFVQEKITTICEVHKIGFYLTVSILSRTSLVSAVWRNWRPCRALL